MFLPTEPIILLLIPLALITLAASFIQLRKNNSDLAKRQKEIDQKIYETLILREIGERIGYELNIGKILDTVISSLSKLIPYSVVGYMLISPDKQTVDLRFHLEESVNRKFLDTVKTHMLEALNQITPKKYIDKDLKETITGTIVDEGLQAPVSSLWLIPLTINDRGIGVMAVGSKTAGLYKGPEMEVLTKILAQANRAVNNLEKVIASEEEKLSAMVSSMADGVLMLDSNLNLVVINPAAISLLGLPQNTKPTILDVASALSDKLDLRSKLDESIKSDKVVVIDNIVVADKASQILISPVKDGGGKPVGSVVLFHDITAQKQLERLREEFTAMMVHELRAPLTVVRGSTDMFLKNPTLGGQPSGQELLKTMQTSASTMLSLVNDLLDVAKIEAGKFQILPTKNNLADVIKDRVTFFSQLAGPKSITLEADLPDTNLQANFDRDRISQVLNNLLSNAIKFTPVGGKITVGAYKVNSASDIRWRFGGGRLPTSAKFPAILVAVSDTGTGIPQEKVGDLFSKFKQLTPVSSEQKGTGLGLVIAKGITESHGGIIFVESKVDEGTTFYLTLPLP